ncbi:MAG TPA: hypothetical protein IAD47_07555 [Candidatus Limihabitans stercoravium]|nr:hypothetical protein [Candidatus Limihabitans stercoravium]
MLFRREGILSFIYILTGGFTCLLTCDVFFVLQCTLLFDERRFFVEKIGVVGIVVEDLLQVSAVQQILSKYGQYIVGRMGVPDRQHNCSVIALIVRGETDKLSALTGTLGRISGIKVKSALTDAKE